MTHLETEIQLLKRNIVEMWNIVNNQLDKSQQTISNFDKDFCGTAIPLVALLIFIIGKEICNFLANSFCS